MIRSRFTVDRLGARGDGIADTDTGPLFIPFTLPGETVTAAPAKDRAALLAVLDRSPIRVAPPCRHFGECGGCAVQHMAPAAYAEWKRDLVADALRQRGIAAPVAPLVPCAPMSRRRVQFSLRRTENGILLGYNRALSRTIIDIAECPIAMPQIVAATESLRRLGEFLCHTQTSFRLAVTMTELGLDVDAADCGIVPEPARRLAADHAIRSGFARLTLEGEIVVEARKPAVAFGTTRVAIPPRSFLQAVAASEEAMAERVLGHLAGAKRVADLFSGCGTFALRLATKAEVHAVEADAAPLAALDRARRVAPGLKRVTTERRDLERRPLTFKELSAFDAVCFDPPRAGAEAQCRQIARSEVPRVAAVSCNPATLARDLAILAGGGYAVKNVIPIDQFLWSPHVETVALLEKPRRRR